MAKRKRRRVPPQAEQPMDIVFVSAEAAPWSKTGGLGDVVGSLPIALADRGHRVMVVVPRSGPTCFSCQSEVASTLRGTLDVAKVAAFACGPAS